MILTPVIIRELRAESRRAGTGWMRVLGAAAVVVVFTVVLIDQHGSAATIGSRLFLAIHATLIACIGTLGAAMTSDCLSSERREGTLGLLFLTPLTAPAIVLGKSLVLGVRVFSLLIAAIPMLAVTVMLGGVSWIDVLSALTFQFSAALLAVTAGLISSSYSRVSLRALTAAVVLALFFFVAFAGIIMVACVGQLGGSLSWSTLYRIFGRTDELREITATVFLGARGMWNLITIRYQTAWLCILSESLLVAFVIFRCGFQFAAWRLKRSWQEQPRSARSLKVTRFFTAPRFLPKLFRRRLRRSLDRNPISWLQQYSWTARITKWGWCLAVLTFDAVAASATRYDDFFEIQRWLIVALLLGLAFTSVSSFLREKQTAVLELLLVSPLPARDLIVGRVLGIWAQFLPATFVVACTVIGVTFPPFKVSTGDLDFFAAAAVACFTLPFAGLYCAFRFQNVLLAWVAAVLFGLVIPVALGFFTERLFGEVFWLVASQQLADEDVSYLDLALIPIVQLLVAALAYFLLHRNLTRRTGLV